MTSTKTRHRLILFALPGIIWLLSSCAGKESAPPSGDSGTISMRLATPPEVASLGGVLFEVTNADGEVQTQTVQIEEEPLPAAADPSSAGRRFADWFVVLNPGTYQVRATPLNENGAASDACAVAEGTADVFAEMTTEIVLTSECTQEGSGALDTVVTFNSPPFISDLSIDPSKFVCQHQAVTLELSASDADGDDLSLTWEVVEQPEGSDDSAYCLAYAGTTASFVANVNGKYELLVTVSDGSASSRLRFPIYVSCDGQGGCLGEPVLEALGTIPDGFSGTCQCEPQELPTISVSDNVQPAVATVESTIEGQSPRPVSRYVNSEGEGVDFVSNELIVTTSDPDALNDFLARWNGEVITSMDFSELGVSGEPVVYHVRVDTTLANVADMAQQWQDNASVVGAQTFSDGQGQALVAAALSEGSTPNIQVGLNFLLESDDFSRRISDEDPAGAAAPDGTPYTSNAFEWPYMRRGGVQDIGTAEAWRVLEATGRLGNRVRIGIADGGFIPNADFPASLTAVGPLRVPNPESFRLRRWWGTHAGLHLARHACDHVGDGPRRQ